MKNLPLFLCLSFLSLPTFAVTTALIKIPTVCGDTLDQTTSKCSVKIDCPDQGEKFTVNLTYSCAGKQFKTTMTGEKHHPPSGLLTRDGMFFTSPARVSLFFVGRQSMTESKVSDPSAKGSFFFFNHDRNLLELSESKCGGKDTISLKGKCYKVKERTGLTSR